MLKYFFSHYDIKEICGINESLNEVKKCLSNGEYTNIYSEYDKCQPLFENIVEIARERNDEYLANSQYVAREYYLLFYNIGSYFCLLQEKEYKKSWDKLQDCFDICKNIGKYTDIKNRLEIPQILDLLMCYESLYPYNVFASSEYIITKSHCSICGESMQSLACSHIKGQLYWGQVAIEIIDEIKEFQAVCLVSHPEDKRCTMELVDDNRTEIEKFCKLNEFLSLNIPRLQIFSVETRIESRKKDNIIIVERNEPCPCGSGLKFKKCCGKDLYYKHERNIVTPLNMIELNYD